MLQLAISGTELEPDESLSELVESAKDLGVTHVELWYPRNTGAEGFDAAVEVLREANLQVACVSTGSELYRNGHSFEDQSLLIQGIEYAGKCGSSFANTYFGYYSVQDDEAAIDTYCRLLQPCLKAAEKNNVTIVLENEFNAFGVDHVRSDITRRPDVLKRLFEKVNSPFFRLNFDACNFYCAGVEPYPYAYELLHPFIGYIHVKDGCRYDSYLNSKEESIRWRRFTDYDDEFIMRPMGDGAVPWSNIIKRLQKDKYSGFMTLEPHADTVFRRQAWKQASEYVRNQLTT